jgi:hypothetical protein
MSHSVAGTNQPTSIGNGAVTANPNYAAHRSRLDDSMEILGAMLDDTKFALEVI